ncbi:hypothetical protein B0A52_08386 [Exophiala mesophila]|uniref:Uncharacterized protein n=1 Tax=Exophiala mesophila TaxID=212818 RepID=A0A438MW38_EXOME|nr:hypothetical protein B0A52_08386 [Exophiala mesophila]
MDAQQREAATKSQIYLRGLESMTRVEASPWYDATDQTEGYLNSLLEIVNQHITDGVIPQEVGEETRSTLVRRQQQRQQRAARDARPVHRLPARTGWPSREPINSQLPSGYTPSNIPGYPQITQQASGLGASSEADMNSEFGHQTYNAVNLSSGVRQAEQIVNQPAMPAQSQMSPTDMTPLPPLNPFQNSFQAGDMQGGMTTRMYQTGSGFTGLNNMTGPGYQTRSTLPREDHTMSFGGVIDPALLPQVSPDDLPEDLPPMDMEPSNNEARRFSGQQDPQQQHISNQLNEVYPGEQPAVRLGTNCEGYVHECDRCLHLFKTRRDFNRHHYSRNRERLGFAIDKGASYTRNSAGQYFWHGTNIAGERFSGRLVPFQGDLRQSKYLPPCDKELAGWEYKRPKRKMDPALGTKSKKAKTANQDDSNNKDNAEGVQENDANENVGNQDDSREEREDVTEMGQDGNQQDNNGTNEHNADAENQSRSN